jgi:lipoprotein-anchoring transpeptidase ErfK/SrfK
MEILYGYDPLTKGKLKDGDFDKDGLSDRLELLFDVDPTVPDTDGDGRKDGAEVEAGYSPTSTEAVVLEKSIRITLANQRLERVVGGIPISSHAISGGLPKTPTPVGEFTVLNKHPRAWSRSAGLWMPYWMHFSGRGHGIHELPEWPGGYKEGANHLGRPASHGCVRLGVGTAKLVYEWSTVGTRVTVQRSPTPLVMKPMVLTSK